MGYKYETIMTCVTKIRYLQASYLQYMSVARQSTYMGHSASIGRFQILLRPFSLETFQSGTFGRRSFLI